MIIIDDDIIHETDLLQIMNNEIIITKIYWIIHY